MKKDQKMIQAAILISRLQFQQGISPEAAAIASFIKSVMLPLMTEPENSSDYKDAKRNLVERGRNAKQFMANNKTLDSYLSNFLM